MGLLGFWKAGSAGSTSTWVRMVANGHVLGKDVAQFLLDHVADHALGLGAEHVERERLDPGHGRRLQSQQAYLGPVAVSDDQAVVAGQGRQGAGGHPDVLPLVLRGERLPPLEKGVAAERRRRSSCCPLR